MKRFGRFEAYLVYLVISLVFAAFIFARLQAFEGWLLVPARGSESVAVRPAAAFSLAPLQRNAPTDALLVDNPRLYQQFLDEDKRYDAAQLPFHIGMDADSFHITMSDTGRAESVAATNRTRFRIGRWQLRWAKRHPDTNRYQVLIAKRIAFTPSQLAGALLFAAGAVGFAIARWWWQRQPATS